MVCRKIGYWHEEGRNKFSDNPVIEARFRGESGGLRIVLPDSVDWVHDCDWSRHGLQLHEDHSEERNWEPEGTELWSTRPDYQLILYTPAVGNYHTPNYSQTTKFKAGSQGC